LDYDLSNSNRVTALKQLFGQVVYQADNQLYYNYLPAGKKNLPDAHNIIPACKLKDNSHGRLTFWYNENTGMLKVNFDVAVPYSYASKISRAFYDDSSLDIFKTSLKDIFNPKWLTNALKTAASQTPSSSCFISAMRQLDNPGATVTCGGAKTVTTTKADEAKEVQAAEVQAEEVETERKLRGAATTTAEEAERKLVPIKKIKTNVAVKVLGGATNGWGPRRAAARHTLSLAVCQKNNVCLNLHDDQRGQGRVWQYYSDY